MIGQTISHYRILEELGQGGMGVVYRAEDLRLKRTVAMKFLPERLSRHSEARERFEQEAQSASSLNHPNITTIYEIDEISGQIFIVMEYVDDMTLRSWVRMKATGPSTPSKPLAREATELAVQIAEALCAAHDKGIVHRDVKSDNIMVTRDGRVKLMDFGLAKLRGVSELTRAGSTIGTVAYMSPEQAEGLEADHRTDIYSFGVVLYEMLAGCLPFQAPHEAGLIYEIMNVEPKPPSDMRPDVEPELDRIVLKCLEKDRDVRYQSMKEVLVDLKRYRRDSEGKRIERRATQPVPIVSPTPAPVTPVPASPGEPPPQTVVLPRRRPRLAVLSITGLIAVAAIAVLYVLFFRPKPMDSIAVLPFMSVGGEPSDEYLTDGLTESIINNLTKLSRLRVIPRSTVFHYKGKDTDPLTIGHELGVHAVLVGRVRQHGDDLDVQTELVDVDENTQLWGDQFAAKASNAQSLQGTISRQIAEKLRIRLTSAEAQELAARPTENAEAYRLYLQGLFYWNKRRGADIVRAIDYFTQATDRDPNFALAYAGLASAYALMPEYGRRPTKEFMPKSQAAVQKALELDPDLAEAHAVKGLLLHYQFDWAGAEAEFKRAIQLNPNYPSAYHWYQIILRMQKRFAEARVAIDRAKELDPLSPIIALNSGILYYHTGQYAEALREFNQVAAMSPDFHLIHNWFGRLYLEEGKMAEAEEELLSVRRAAGENAYGLADLSYTYAVQGKKKEATALLDTLLGFYRQGYSVETGVALAYVGMGDRDNALAWLLKAVEAQEAVVAEVNLDTRWKPFRSDPRFVEALKTMHLDQ